MSETNGAERYRIKREAGISPQRKDGSMTSERTDVEAAAAERYAADFFGVKYNDAVHVHGDGGHDFKLLGLNAKELAVEVVWLGFVKGTDRPRTSGHLIVNPDEPHRWADIYIVVSGCKRTGFSIVGWTTHSYLVVGPKKDFGYGEKFAVQTNELFDISYLKEVNEVGQCAP